MATSSIFAQLRINNDKEAKAFLDALESSKAEAEKRGKMPDPEINELEKEEDIRKFLRLDDK